MPLTDIACRNLKPREKPYKMADSGGLYLEVYPGGGKYWRWKYRWMNKEKRISLGGYPLISLAEARERRDQARKLLTNEQDPSEAKQARKAARITVASNTFELMAREWHTKNLNNWTERHAAYVLRRLELDVFKLIGHRPISEITPKEVITVLRSIESRGARELARRLKQTIDQVFRYALIEEKITSNPVAGFQSKDVLQKFTKGHYAALDSKELPEFLQKLERNDARLYPHTRMAVKLLLLTFVRTSELIEADWNEFDLEGGQWLIPAHRMKMRQAHIVPLSSQAISILKELEQLSFAKKHQDWPDYVFPNQVNARKAMSNNTILKALERLGYKGRMTGHGFRALAMSTIKEKLGYRHEVVDRQLAHAPRNKVDAAYDRAQFLDERRVMMEEWSNYLDKLNQVSTK